MYIKRSEFIAATLNIISNQQNEFNSKDFKNHKMRK
jgi:hypothetical protein